MRKFTELKKGLSHFGLNPYDWEIKTIYNEQCILIHRHDPNLKLYGEIAEDPKGLGWQRLSFEHF